MYRSLVTTNNPHSYIFLQINWQWIYYFIIQTKLTANEDIVLENKTKVRIKAQHFITSPFFKNSLQALQGAQKLKTTARSFLFKTIILIHKVSQVYTQCNLQLFTVFLTHWLRSCHSENNFSPDFLLVSWWSRELQAVRRGFGCCRHVLFEK